MEGAWASPGGPAPAPSHWAWARAPLLPAFLLVRACKPGAPLGRANLGTKFKDFKSTQLAPFKRERSAKQAAGAVARIAVPPPRGGRPVRWDEPEPLQLRRTAALLLLQRRDSRRAPSPLGRL